MGFWGGRRLFNELSQSPIVTPFAKEQIDCNAYTLRMGPEYYVTPEPGEVLRKNKKGLLRDPRDFSTPWKTYKVRGGSLVIPSGQFAFLLSEEVVHIPNNVMGFISLKSATKFRGLINVSGFHVDPGFHGSLIYSVFNAGPTPLHIQRLESLFLLWLADLDGPVEAGYYKNMQDPQLEIPIRLVSDVAREVSSIQSYSDRLQAVERKVGYMSFLAWIAVTALTLYFAYLQVEAKFFPEVKSKAEAAGNETAAGPG